MKSHKKDFLARFGSDEHIDSLIKDKKYENQHFLMENPGIKPHQIESLANTMKDRYIINHIVRDEKTPDHVIDKFINNANFHSPIAAKPNLASHHIDKLIGPESPDAVISRVARFSKNLNNEHYKKLVKHPSWNVRYELASNKHVPDNVLVHLSGDDNEHVEWQANQTLNSRSQNKNK